MSKVNVKTTLGQSSSSRSVDTRKKKATAFAVIGDRYHNSDYIRMALGKTLVKEAGLSIDPPLPTIEAKPRWWMKPTQGKAVKKFVEDGGSAFFYHNSSNISLSNEDFRDVEGANYTGHPPVRPFKVRIVNKNHPITKGVKDFIVTDEQHYVKYDKDERYVFMESENIDGLSYTGLIGDQGRSCEAGWAYDFGRGRVCFMAPGHMISVLWNTEFIKLQKNAVKWLLREI
jgi:type 1 glutamine amidotransferase